MTASDLALVRWANRAADRQATSSTSRSGRVALLHVARIRFVCFLLAFSPAGAGRPRRAAAAQRRGGSGPPRHGAGQHRPRFLDRAAGPRRHVAVAMLSQRRRHRPRSCAHAASPARPAGLPPRPPCWSPAVAPRSSSLSQAHPLVRVVRLRYVVRPGGGARFGIRQGGLRSAVRGNWCRAKPLYLLEAVSPCRLCGHLAPCR